MNKRNSCKSYVQEKGEIIELNVIFFVSRLLFFNSKQSTMRKQKTDIEMIMDLIL